MIESGKSRKEESNKVTYISKSSSLLKNQKVPISISFIIYEKEIYEGQNLGLIIVLDWQQETICKIIGEIAYAGTDSVVPSTIEGKCVQDADRLDAIGAVGIARAFAYGGSHNRYMHNPDIQPKLNMTAEEYHKSNSTTLNHFHEKLFNLKDVMSTDTAKAIAKGRDEYMKAFVDTFMAEWDGKQ